MKVHFHSEKVLGGKAYGKGVATLHHKHAYTSEFKKLVKDGHVSILPRSEAEQKLQSHADAHAVRKAAKMAKTSKASQVEVAEKASAPVKAKKA